MSARDGCATRAESETNRNFALPGRSANELQTGDIGAGDEQDDERSADDEEQTFTVIADHQIAERHQIEVPTFVEFRVALREPRGDRGQLCLNAGHRHASLDPSDDAPKARGRDEVFTALVRKQTPLR